MQLTLILFVQGCGRAGCVFLSDATPLPGAAATTRQQYNTKVALRFLRRHHRNGETLRLVSELYTHWCAPKCHATLCLCPQRKEVPFVTQQTLEPLDVFRCAVEQSAGLERVDIASKECWNLAARSELSRRSRKVVSVHTTAAAV